MNTEIGNSGAPFATSPTGNSVNWHAQLQLRFAARQQRTVLVERTHSGPLVVQKPLYPEGETICHAVIVHPPGGIAGGDQLQLHVQVDASAHALLTTPGAGKWYKANGAMASQQLQFAIAENALLEWLPQETILFDAAQARMQTQVRLAANARYAGWEILCFGRSAAGEKFAAGQWRQRVQIFRDDELIWGEYANVRGGDALFDSPVGMNGNTIAARLLIAAGATPTAIVDACREVAPKHGDQFGVTALPEILAATYLGTSAEHARDYFEMLWQVLRPWYANVAAQRPRIWST